MSIQLSDRQRDLLIWIMVGLGFLLIVIMIVFIVVIVNQNTRSGGTEGGGSKSVIYGLYLRPLPPARINGTNDLFPQTYGQFTRKAGTTTIRGQGTGTFQASYSRNKDVIDITGARDNNYAQAEADMRRAIAQMGGTSQVVTLDTTFGYTLISSDKQAQLIWFHANWYWNITANSKAALDDFMKVFPY